jgi:hypothetical protein
MTRSEQTTAAIAGAVVTGGFAVLTVILAGQAGKPVIVHPLATPTVTVTKLVPVPGPTVYPSARPHATATVTKLVLVAPVRSSSPHASASKAFNWTGLSAFIAAIGTLLGGLAAFFGVLGIVRRRSKQDPATAAASGDGQSSPATS